MAGTVRERYGNGNGCDISFPYRCSRPLPLLISVPAFPVPPQDELFPSHSLPMPLSAYSLPIPFPTLTLFLPSHFPLSVYSLASHSRLLNRFSHPIFHFFFYFFFFNLTYSRWTSSLPSCLWSQRIFPSLPDSCLTIFIAMQV